ncbi:hypothetical protein M9H77_17130 [Catharanthus roseus]|uniref:Uncharacterized protein n=1 Tax=Catharanthus roseus TaxID=4058 RepID=A0ACC0B3Q6_CATRO|nr:hypothetical protein M9H77_17130 [Catharanthus roseus]
MEPSQDSAAAKVISLFIYPIKSCRGISVDEAPLCSSGLRWDRLWMVVNGRGRAYTQRVEPKLALVQVEMPMEAFSDVWKPDRSSFLGIRAPGMDVLKIPLLEPSVVIDGVSVWEWSGSALDEGNEASEWFSNYLGKRSRLVRFNEAAQTRPVNAGHVQTYRVKFNDMYPFLLASQGSLNTLNDRLKEPIQMSRFRPNILVDGCEPFIEDFWKEIKINSLTFYSGELCYSCKVPTIDQETAIAAAGAEPTETLRTFRSDKVLLPKHKHQGRVYFGHTFVCKDSVVTQSKKANTIKVGDPVYALKAVSSYDDVNANSDYTKTLKISSSSFGTT